VSCAGPAVRLTVVQGVRRAQGEPVDGKSVSTVDMIESIIRLSDLTLELCGSCVKHSALCVALRGSLSTCHHACVRCIHMIISSDVGYHACVIEKDKGWCL
jgi:hypothetical protein